ncbi:hypothetical protein [Nonomuraea sp. NPDC049141]|uniref:hypothetical protein n=1 Tax=Nonomuraea sp. NPDC049141 TaxID=3155500 RepID=UPI0033F87290
MAKIRQMARPSRGVPLLGTNNIFAGFVETVVTDIDEALDPKAPLLRRWRASSRRQAGRRSVRTLLRVYCPELLDQFVDAFEQRAEWVLEHREQFDRWFDGSRSDDEIDQLLREMDTTARQLRSARDQMRTFIVAKYPMGRAGQVGLIVGRDEGAWRVRTSLPPG